MRRPHLRSRFGRLHRAGSTLLLLALTPVLCLLAGGASGPPARAAAAPQYAVIDLNPVGSPGLAAQAQDLNDDGEVVGLFMVSSEYYEAFRTEPLTPVNPDTDLLGTLARGRPSLALAINDSGQVTGNAGVGDRFYYHAFRTSGGGRITASSDLGAITSPSIPNDLGYSQGEGINDGGMVCGRADGQAYKTAGRVTRESLMGTLFPDPVKPGEYLGQSYAVDINDSGAVIGQSVGQIPGGATVVRSFRSTGPKILSGDDLGTLGGDSAWAVAINRSGQVTGWSTATNGNGQAFLTAPNGRITQPLPLLTGGTHSTGLDVNDRGQAVGECNTTAVPEGQYPYRAVLWEAGKVIDLNTLIAPDSGWVLHRAFGINNQGHILVEGNGPRGHTRAGLMVPLPRTDLGVALDHEPSSVRVGEEVSYILTIRNGSQPAPGVVVSAELPANADFVRSTPAGALSGRTLRLGPFTLGPSGRQEIVIAVRPRAVGTARLTATVSGQVADSNPANNMALRDVRVTAPASADLAVSMTDSPDPIKTGQPLTYTVEVRNLGPDPANNVELDHQLPPGVNVVSARTSHGSVSRGGNSILGSLGRLNKGVTARVTVVVSAATAGTLNSEAVASADEPDPTSGNNRATAQTTVQAGRPRPDLVGSWSPITYTFKVPPKGGKKDWVMEATFTVRNIGKKKIRKPFKVEFWGSRDQDPGSGGDKRLVKTKTVPKLGPGRSKVMKVAEVVPRNADGTGSQLKGLFAIAIIDAKKQVPEMREDNNVVVSQALP